MRYEIVIFGYGSEATIGQPSREQMQALLEDNGEELIGRVSELDPPHYEIDDQMHVWGASYGGSTIIVADEDGNEVLNTETGVGIEDDGSELFEFSYKEIDQSLPLLIAVSGEKGTFFEASFECDRFDAAKLKIHVQEEVGIDQYYAGDIIYGASYDGEELDNIGGDTTGKYFEAAINFDLSDLRGMKLDDVME